MKVYMDNSAAGALASCTTKGILRYGLGYTSVQDSGPLAVGKVAHTALDVYLRGGANEKAQKVALGRYAVEYLKLVPEDVEERLSLENTSMVLEKWFEAHREDQLLFYLEDAEFEQEVAVNVTDDVVFFGRLDGLARSKLTGAWEVIEHKTTGSVNSYWSSQWHTSSQLTGYTWAAGKILEEPVRGCVVNAIEFSLLPSDPVRKCKKHGTAYAECRKEHAKWEWISTTRAPWQVERWKEDFVEIAMAYKEVLDRVRGGEIPLDKLPMEGTFTGACRFCELQTFCGMGRGEQLISLLLRKDPWALSMAGMEQDG